MANQSKLKAWVRYDGTGRVVTAGPIFQANKPKVGNWRQINADLCCNSNGTTTTTTTQGGGVTPTAWMVQVYPNSQDACTGSTGFGPYIVYTAGNNLIAGVTLWSDAALTIPYSPYPGRPWLAVSTQSSFGTNAFYAEFNGSTTTITQETACQTVNSYYGYAAGSSNNACTQSGGNPGVNLYSSGELGVNTQLFFDSGLTNPYAGQYGNYFNVNGTVYEIGSGGYIISSQVCVLNFIGAGDNSSGGACNAVNGTQTFYTTGPLVSGNYPQNGITVYFDQALTQPVSYAYVASPGIGQVWNCNNGVLSNQANC